MHGSFGFLLFSLSLCLAAMGAPIKAPHLTVELVANQSQLKPGEAFRLGLFFKLEKHWHVYWQNPGDSGETPDVKWQLDDGAQVDSFLWPIPKRITVGPLVNYGYEDEILLPIPAKLDDSFSEKSASWRGEVSWLVCAEICVPGKANLHLRLPVSAETSISSIAWNSFFEGAERQIPMAAPAAWKQSGSMSPETIRVKVEHIAFPATQASFFPIEQDEIKNAVAPKVNLSGGSVTLEFARSDRLVQTLTHFPGLLLLSDKNGMSQGYTIDVPLGTSTVDGSIALSILFAFLGGLILNLMPCVFPVLSIKILSIVKMAGENPRRIRRMSWAYSLGIHVSFWTLVVALLLLRFGGEQIGWGFQLQSPQFVFALACLLFAFGLNLLGVFEISGSFTGVGGRLADKEGYAGSFFTGVLATLVATPCTAPFMGSAVGFALGQPTLIVFAIFTALAFGLAFPYLLISYLPAVGRWLPRPGAWMETFKHLMAFPIFATVVWLSWVLGLQAAVTGIVTLLASLVLIGFAAWLAGRFVRYRWATGLAVLIVVLATVAGCWYLKTALPSATSVAVAEGELAWEAYSPKKLAEYRSQGRPVFVDFTAAWCVSCQVNELLVFKSEDVKKKLRELNFVLFKADWTNQDPVVTEALAAFGRNGVPFYLIYGKGKDAPAVPLPEVINAGLVLNELEKIR